MYLNGQQYPENAITRILSSKELPVKVLTEEQRLEEIQSRSIRRYSFSSIISYADQNFENEA